MLLIDELFMFLCRLQCGLLAQDLAVRFNCNLLTVSRKIITWANFLYFVLGSINIWPSKQQINEKMPQSFMSLYPSTRVIIDCTEIRTERPSSLALGSKMLFIIHLERTSWDSTPWGPHFCLLFVYRIYVRC